jgi:hypothetical protein
MRYLLPFILLSACGGLTTSEPTEQLQSVTLGYSASNGSTSMPTTSTRFCVAYYFAGANAHGGSPVWPNGKPKEGATIQAFPPTLTALPYSTSVGSATAYAECMDFSNFGFGPAASQSSDTSPYYILRNLSHGQNFHTATQEMWFYPSGFCYLNGVLGLSASNEEGLVTPYLNHWYLYAGGHPSLGSSGKCIFPDRPVTHLGPYLATSGSGPTWGPSTSGTICGFSRITGNLDDGWAWINKASGQWTIQSSGVTAEMRCVAF